MSDGFNLQNILQTGFFTTSRARHSSSPSDSHLHPLTSAASTASSHIPRSLERHTRYRRTYPPPPLVEDEAVSLGKELGALVIPIFEEEPQSRGEIDQQPIILEVFEYNPERRFVVLPGSLSLSDSGAEDKAAKKRAHKEAKSTKSRQSRPDNRSRRDPDHRERLESPDGRPNLGRRKSRQDLPRIQTDLEELDAPVPHHHRSRSCAGDARPNLTPHRHHRRRDGGSGDEFLSPGVPRHSPRGRDRVHYGSDERRDERRDDRRGLRSQTPGGWREKGERVWDGKRWRSLTPTVDGRSSSRFRTGSSQVPSYERLYDCRLRDAKRSSRSPRSDTRDNFDSPRRRRESDFGRSPSSRKYRENIWSSIEAHLRDSRHLLYPLATDDGRSSLGIPSEDVRISRSPSRVRTMPVSSSRSEGFTETEKTPLHQTLSALPLETHEESEDHPRANLPYPDDDESQKTWSEGASDCTIPRQSQPGTLITSMPPIPPVLDEIGADDGQYPGGSRPQPSVPQPWLLPFDYENEHMPSDKPAASDPRHSDGKKTGDEQELALPQCTRTMPIAGLVDWITLPRTRFVICPDCFGDVFEHTKYRKFFQPLSRPAMSPIACDFGSSPWYRIAWLLTLKEQKLNLQSFYRVAGVLNATTTIRPCPGSQKAMDYWYTVKDPFTRRAVPDFTVCYECAKTVEALFPALRDVFTPQDAWKEPTRSTCSLHFAPDRNQFALYLDSFQAAAGLAIEYDTSPDVGDLCMTLSRITTLNECRERRPISNGYWYTLSFLPEFTVCGQCYEEAVRPQQSEDSDIAQSFHPKPRKLPVATCQLYSPRMRDMFKRACRRNDCDYLEESVRERRKVKEDLHAKFVNLTRDRRSDRWTEAQIDKLEREWEKWE